MHEVADTWAETCVKIAKGQLPRLGAPFNTDLADANLFRMQRTKFAPMTDAAIDNLDHAAKFA